MEQPLISLVVPNYNAEKYISAFIESILSQTYSNWELLIVDDASTDKSIDIARKYAEHDSRIRVLTRGTLAKGACARRNQGMREAKGEFLCWFDSDDLLPNYTLQERVEEMCRYTDMDFIVSPGISFDKEPFDIQRLALGLPIFKDDLKMFLKRYRLPFAVWTNTYRVSFLIDNKIEWDEKLASMQDSDLNIRCLAMGAKYKYTDSLRPGYYWRVGGNPSSITKKIQSANNLNSQIYFFCKLRDKFAGTKYKNDIERFGLTLLLRFAMCDTEIDATPLISHSSYRWRYNLLKKIYKISILRKLYPIVQLMFFPSAIGEEYHFQIENRRKCKQYISDNNPNKHQQ